MLRDLVEGIERLENGETCPLKSVEGRIAFATTVEEKSFGGKNLEGWQRAIDSIADREQCPQYGGLVIEPIIGFVPIGRDPSSGLWEFADLQTGAIPRCSQDQKLILTEDMGLVFVLIPGGTFFIEAMPPSEENPQGSSNADPSCGNGARTVTKTATKVLRLTVPPGNQPARTSVFAEAAACAASPNTAARLPASTTLQACASTASAPAPLFRCPIDRLDHRLQLR